MKKTKLIHSELLENISSIAIGAGAFLAIILLPTLITLLILFLSAQGGLSFRASMMICVGVLLLLVLFCSFWWYKREGLYSMEFFMVYSSLVLGSCLGFSIAASFMLHFSPWIFVAERFLQNFDIRLFNSLF